MSNLYYEIYIENELAASSEWNIGIISPKVEKEINTAGSFTFQITPNHPKWGQLYRMKTVVDVLIRGKNVFRGRVSEVEMNFQKTKTVTCEGALAYFCDAPRSKDPEKSKSLEAIVPTPQMVELKLLTNSLDGINDILESHKHFTLGLCERPMNLFLQNDIISGHWSSVDGTTKVDDASYVTETDYIPFDISMTYEVYVDQYYGNVFSSQFYVYDEQKRFKRYFGISVSKLNKKVFKDADIEEEEYETYAYIRVSARTSLGNIFGLVSYAYYNDDDEDDKDNSNSNSFSGGPLSDYLSKWLVDAHHALVRTRVENNQNVLDILSQDRTGSVATIEFSRNLVDLTIEKDDFEPYSILIASFSGTIPAGLRTSISQEVPGMVEKYGIIYKIIDTGIEYKDSWSIKEIEKKINKARQFLSRYIRLFDPNIPDNFTIKALDDGVIFDNDQLAIIDVGDPVMVISQPHNVSKTLLCLNVSLDICEPSNNEYKIGKYVQDDEDYKIKTLTESFKKEKKK